MWHNKRGKEIDYKVCVYRGNGRDYEIIKTFRSYDKANNFLSQYLRENLDIERAFIEKSYSFCNNKREQWKDND